MTGSNLHLPSTVKGGGGLVGDKMSPSRHLKRFIQWSPFSMVSYSEASVAHSSQRAPQASPYFACFIFSSLFLLSVQSLNFSPPLVCIWPERSSLRQALSGLEPPDQNGQCWSPGGRQLDSQSQDCAFLGQGKQGRREIHCNTFSAPESTRVSAAPSRVQTAFFYLLDLAVPSSFFFLLPPRGSNLGKIKPSL
jgi:hypothetical protein